MKIVIPPPLVTCTFLLVATIASTIAIYATPLLRKIVRQQRGILIALIATATLLRCPFGAPFYHGMEYEDCFVHQAASDAPRRRR